MPDLQLRGRPPSALPLAVARAGMFSVVSTVLAIATYHFVFGSMPSWGTQALAVAGLFGAALPRAAHPASVGRWLTVVIVGQAVAVWWFHQTGSGLASAARDGWFIIPVHARSSLLVAQLVLTLLMACMLHSADAACRRLLRNAVRELQAARASLWRLLCPAFVPYAPVLPQAHTPRSSGPARASPLCVLLADAVVRRGPPSRLPLAV
jgi:hypothetical protein